MVINKFLVRWIVISLFLFVLVTNGLAWNVTFERAKSFALEYGKREGGVIFGRKTFYVERQIPLGGKQIYSILYEPNYKGLEMINLSISTPSTLQLLMASQNKDGFCLYDTYAYDIYKGKKSLKSQRALREEEAIEMAEEFLVIMTRR